MESGKADALILVRKLNISPPPYKKTKEYRQQEGRLTKRNCQIRQHNEVRKKKKENHVTSKLTKSPIRYVLLFFVVETWTKPHRHISSNHTHVKTTPWRSRRAYKTNHRQCLKIRLPTLKQANKRIIN